MKMSLLLCLMNIFKNTRMNKEFTKNNYIYVKSLWLNQQNILLKGCNSRKLLILIKKVTFGFYEQHTGIKFLVILKLLLLKVESFSIIFTAST